MKTIHHLTVADAPRGRGDSHETANQDRIRAMVGCLRERLHMIGDHGDCAYERAMGTKYRELLGELEARLDPPRECA